MNANIAVCEDYVLRRLEAFGSFGLLLTAEKIGSY